MISSRQETDLGKVTLPKQQSSATMQRFQSKCQKSSYLCLLFFRLKPIIHFGLLLRKISTICQTNKTLSRRQRRMQQKYESRKYVLNVCKMNTYRIKILKMFFKTLSNRSTVNKQFFQGCEDTVAVIGAECGTGGSGSYPNLVFRVHFCKITLREYMNTFLLSPTSAG